jgi:hypothetical protein
LQCPYFGWDTTVYLPEIGLRRLQRLCIFFLASNAFTADVRWCVGEGEVRTFQVHYLVGDAVCRTLKWVIDLSDDRLRLYEWGCRMRSACPVGRKHRYSGEIPTEAGNFGHS